MAKKSTSDNAAVIQFRPPEAFGRLINEFAMAWGVARNEAARRLAMLAAYRLTVDHYPAVCRLETTPGGTQDFVSAVDIARAALDSTDRTRKELDSPPLGGWEGVTFLERWIDDFLTGHRPHRVIRIEGGQEQPATTPNPSGEANPTRRIRTEEIDPIPDSPIAEEEDPPVRRIRRRRSS